MLSDRIAQNCRISASKVVLFGHDLVPTPLFGTYLSLLESERPIIYWGTKISSQIVQSTSEITISLIFSITLTNLVLPLSSPFLCDHIQSPTLLYFPFKHNSVTWNYVAITPKAKDKEENSRDFSTNSEWRLGRVKWGADFRPANFKEILLNTVLHASISLWSWH